MTTRLTVGEAPDIRRHNLSQLLRLLHLGGPMRRSQLTDLTGLNRSTVAGLVAELAALGAVLEEPAEADRVEKNGKKKGKQAKAGRPSPLVRPRPEMVQVLAADVAIGRVSMALIGLGGTVVSRRSRQTTDHPSARTIARLLAALGRELLAGPRAGNVLALGVSVPGVVRGQDGHVRFAPNLGWEDQPLGELLDVALADRGICLRVGLANDGDLGVLAEHQRGVARGYDDVVFVEGETGVGSGVISGGRPLAGSGGYAGELGHLTIRRDGRRCRCGARGCWETEIGAGAMARALGLPEGSDEGQVGVLLRSAGNAALAPRLDEVAEYLGIGLANVVNVFNPQLVILGGLLQDLYPLVADRVTEVLGSAALRAPMEQVRLVLPELGADAVLLGAGEYAWREVLADPVAALS